ncbi:MAG TPA: GerMN domain-containing protein [Candidatus Methylomirabilis sp.]|nr:GerMN domain-containing protein [Candidatus Methylomirabilis sp.]
MKHFLIYLVAFLFIVCLAIFNLRLLLPENGWVCQNGVWVRHGVPFTAQPDARLCGIDVFGHLTPSDKPVPGTASSSADQIVSEIKLTAPAANEIISSPLTVTGEALGNWYFEASFPVKLIGENGETLAQAPAQAQGDWMTTDFVPFKVTLNFDPGTSTIGMLILKNDNPSGIPEKDKQVAIPVRFSGVQKITVKPYFANTILNPQAADCSLVYPVERLINKTSSTARAAMEQLLAGPTDEEKMQGYYTAINPGVKLNSITIANGTAKVDFDEQMDFQLGGSCRVTAIRSQITQTLLQFPSVSNVVISVNGNTSEALQP